MSGKKVTFGTKPQAEKLPSDPDTWVSGGAEVKTEPDTQPEPISASSPAEMVKINTEAEKMKRLTIDIPPALHTRIKVECAQRQKKIADIVRQLLEQEFPES